MEIKRTSTMVAALLVGFAGLTLLRQSQPVHAQDQLPPPIGDHISFGMVGITAGQTIRLSVVNTLPPGPILPPGPSRVVMTFRGLNGQLLRNARTGEVIGRVVDLERGTAAFLDLDYNELPPGPTRRQLRAIVNALYPPGTTELPPSPIVPSLEVMNSATRRTQFIVSNPGTLRGFNPQPDPPFEATEGRNE